MPYNPDESLLGFSLMTSIMLKAIKATAIKFTACGGFIQVFAWSVGRLDGLSALMSQNKDDCVLITIISIAFLFAISYLKEETSEKQTIRGQQDARNSQ